MCEVNIMNISKLLIRIVLVLFMGLNFSCNDDDFECDGQDVGVNFNIKVKLTALDGSNHLEDNNFIIASLKVLGENNDEKQFSVIDDNGESIITFEGLNTNAIFFTYNDVEKYNFTIHNVITSNEKCTFDVISYEAQNIGLTICDCSIEDIVTVPFDI